MEFIQILDRCRLFDSITTAMTTTILIIGAAVGGGLFGVMAIQIAQRTKAGNRIKKSEQQAKRIILRKTHQESDRIKKDKMLQAKENLSN